MTAALAILRRIPPWVFVIVALLGWGVWQKHRATSIAETHAKAVSQAAAEREARLQADAAETARRLEAQRSITDEARKKSEALARDAASLRSSEQRLRERLAAIAANAGSGNPSPTAGGPATSETEALLTNMLGSCITRVRELAEYADAARNSGEACERSYESLVK